MSTEALVASAIAALAVVFAAIQILLDQLARRRQYDADLIRWGNAVIALMAEIESQCAPFSPNAGPLRVEVAERLSSEASALVDQGRLFFPNLDVVDDERGYRVKLLDEALRAFYVSRLLAKEGRTDGVLLRCHMWSSRTRFVHLLQEEVRGNLRMARKADQGESIPSDPHEWAAPEFAPEWLRSDVHPPMTHQGRSDTYTKRPKR